eukprot:2702428-Amphidinium_carterae.1
MHNIMTPSKAMCPGQSYNLSQGLVEAHIRSRSNGQWVGMFNNGHSLFCDACGHGIWKNLGT